MVHLISFVTDRFDPAKETPNDINPIPGKLCCCGFESDCKRSATTQLHLKLKIGDGTSTQSAALPAIWWARVAIPNQVPTSIGLSRPTKTGRLDIRCSVEPTC